MAEDPTKAKSKWRKRLGVTVVIGSLLYVVYVLSFYWAISMDDGPFKGVIRDKCPDTSPDQVFDTFSGQELLVFDPWIKDPEAESLWNGRKIKGKRPNGDKAPTVALRGKDGRIKWCILAMGMPDTEVATLRFMDHYNPLPFLHPYVVGRVFWTYGDERMTWSLESSGELNWYKYSW